MTDLHCVMKLLLQEWHADWSENSTVLFSVSAKDLDRTSWSWSRTKRQATSHAEAASSIAALSLTHCGETRLAGSCLALSHVYKCRNKLHPSDEWCYYTCGAGLGFTFNLACYGYDWACLVEPNVVSVVFFIQKGLANTSYDLSIQIHDNIKPLL